MSENTNNTNDNETSADSEQLVPRTCSTSSGKDNINKELDMLLGFSDVHKVKLEKLKYDSREAFNNGDYEKCKDLADQAAFEFSMYKASIKHYFKTLIKHL